MKKILCCILSLFCFVQILYSQQKEYKAYLVATAHFDTQWNWDVRESIDDYAPYNGTELLALRAFPQLYL
jgi:alpha-mannosidase